MMGGRCGHGRSFEVIKRKSKPFHPEPFEIPEPPRNSHNKKNCLATLPAYVCARIVPISLCIAYQARPILTLTFLEGERWSSLTD